MSILRFVPSLLKAERRVYLATPVMDGKPHENYTASLPNAALALAQAGIALDYATERHNPHVDNARNALVRHFLFFAKDCSDLVFVDADIGFEPHDLVRLLSVDRGIVAGIYPRRQGPKDTSAPFPVEFPRGERLVADADGLLEVERVPTGFLRIRRGVLERLSDLVPHYRAEGQPGGEPLYPRIFERVLEGQREYPGDFAFCNKARAEGYRIFVDPEMRFSHAGGLVWSGCLGDWLRRRAAQQEAA